MGHRYTIITIFFCSLILSSLSFPQKHKDINKFINSLNKQSIPLSHPNNQQSGLSPALNSTIIEQYSQNQFGNFELSDFTYITYEDSLMIKNCEDYNNNNTWDNNLYLTYSYDSLKRISKVIQYDRIDGLPRDTVIDIYYYNSVGKASQAISYLNGSLWLRQTYYYDSNNFSTGFLVEINNGSGGWDNEIKDSITNNSLGNPVSDFRVDWNSTSLQWDTVFNWSYEYNSNNLLLVKSLKRWISNAWVNDNKDTYYYNIDNSLSYDESDIWDGTKWSESFYSNYSYVSGKFLKLITHPANQNFLPGSNIPVQWSASGLNAVNIKLSTDNGNTWSLSQSGVPDTGNYISSISAPLNDGPNCKIRIEDASDPGLFDQSSGSFYILFAYDTLTQNTGKIKMTVFNNGAIGSNGTIGQGLSFMNSANALYAGGVFFGNITTGAYGVFPSFRINDLAMYAPMRSFTSNSNFNNISTSYYSDSIAGSPYNVLIKEQTFGKTNNPYIFYLYNLTNRSANTLSSFYICTTADWDVGNYASNFGGYLVSRNMTFQFDSSAVNPNYYGIIALSGMSVACLSTSNFSRSSIISYITSQLPMPITTEGDYRTYIGSGPFNIPAGSIQPVGFAFVAGSSLADLESNADLAIADWNAGLVGIKDNIPVLPSNYSLKQNYPNPFNPVTIIEYSLPKETSFKIEIFNSIGQKVKELYKGTQSAGNHKIYLDGSSLSTGVYFYRFTSDQFNETKKLLLLK